jgi:hypothetical protein
MIHIYSVTFSADDDTRRGRMHRNKRVLAWDVLDAARVVESRHANCRVWTVAHAGSLDPLFISQSALEELARREQSPGHDEILLTAAAGKEETAKPWWYPVRCDAQYCEDLRKDYPENASMTDRELIEHYNDGRAFVCVWGTVGEAYGEWERLAEAYLALVEGGRDA